MNRMNRPRREDVDALEQLLIRAHAAREAPTFAREWVDGVMRDIRRQATRNSSFADVPGVVWRAAAVIAVVSTLFVGSVLTWTASQSDADFSALLTMATSDSTLWSSEP